MRGKAPSVVLPRVGLIALAGALLATGCKRNTAPTESRVTSTSAASADAAAPLSGVAKAAQSADTTAAPLPVSTADLPSAQASPEESAKVEVPAGSAWVMSPEGRVVTFADGVKPTRELHVSSSAPDGGDGSKEKPLNHFRHAVQAATPGTHVIVHPGRYEHAWIEKIAGTAEAPIWIGGAKGEEPPVFDDPRGGIHFSGRYFVVHDVVVTGNPLNGINVDDDHETDNPDYTRFVVLRNVRIHSIGGDGNQDCLKMSGVDDFAVLDSDFSRCGNEEGGGIDMVGCHRGVVAGTRLHHLGGRGVQVKGGSADVTLVGNRFEHSGARAAHMGGMTGAAYFRPPLKKGTKEPAEAKRIHVIGNDFIGSTAPVAFIGCMDCLVANNTIVDPDRWILRILQETTWAGDLEFAKSGRGRFVNNLIYYRADKLAVTANVGPNTAPETFHFERNLWFAHDRPDHDPTGGLPVAEKDGIVGKDPKLRSSPNDLRICSGSPAEKAGVALPEVAATRRFGDSLPIGAHTAVACP